MKFSGNAILAAIVSLVFLAAAVTVAVTLGHGLDSNSTPLIVTVLALVGTTIPSLVALAKVDATRQDLKNGLIPAKIKEAAESGHIVPARDPSVRERASDGAETSLDS